MADEIPEGAAVFPTIPVELSVDPLLLAVLHAIVFIAGSDEEIILPEAGEEALGIIAEYLKRLPGDRRRHLAGDIKALRDFAQENGWPKEMAEFLQTFPNEFGLTGSD